MLEDIEFRLRVRVDSNSPEAIVLNYLNSKQTLYLAKDMAMIALMSFWLPLAYRDDDSQEKGNIGRVIRNSIYRLKLHLPYLQQMLGEEVEQEKEVPLFEVGQQKSQLEIQTHTVTADDSSPKPETSQTISEIDSAEPREWFNPLKSGSKLSSRD
jgi:hypothetical protein